MGGPFFFFFQIYFSNPNISVKITIVKTLFEEGNTIGTKLISLAALKYKTRMDDVISLIIQASTC